MGSALEEKKRASKVKTEKAFSESLLRHYSGIQPSADDPNLLRCLSAINAYRKQEAV
jgi:hypothetical protein